MSAAFSMKHASPLGLHASIADAVVMAYSEPHPGKFRIVEIRLQEKQTVLVSLLACMCLLPPSEISVSTTAELVAAVNDENRTVRLAPGTYELPRQLQLSSGTKLLGAGVEKTIITHTKKWQASPKALPDPETRLKGFDMDSYLLRLEDEAADVEIANLTFKGPQVHGAIFGVGSVNLHLHHVRIQDVMWSGLRTLSMQKSKIHDCDFVNAGGKWKKGGIVPGERGGISGGAMFLTWVKDSEIAHNRFRLTSSENRRRHFGVKGRQGKRCRIHHNTIEFGFSIEFPFEGDEDMEIDHNVLRGAVSIPKHAGGKVPESGRTFHIHHNYFTTSYAIEFVRNGVEIDHNLFDFDVAKDGGNLVSGFGKVGAKGPAAFHNNLVNNPGRGVIWINSPYENLTIRNNHIVTRTTATPRTSGLFGLNAESDFSTVKIVDNIIECEGQPRPLLRTEESYAATIRNNKLTNVLDAGRYENAATDVKVGLDESLKFRCGVHEEFTVDGWVTYK